MDRVMPPSTWGKGTRQWIVGRQLQRPGNVVQWSSGTFSSINARRLQCGTWLGGCPSRGTCSSIIRKSDPRPHFKLPLKEDAVSYFLGLDPMTFTSGSLSNENYPQLKSRCIVCGHSWFLDSWQKFMVASHDRSVQWLTRIYCYFSGGECETARLPWNQEPVALPNKLL